MKDFPITIEMLEYGLFGAFCFFIFVRLCYTLFFFSRIAFYKTPKDTSARELPVSIIICAKNEKENLETNLPLILEQDYDNFEVIVVNDQSWDGTSDFLQDIKRKLDHLKVVDINEDNVIVSGKKFALTLGIKAAKFEHLLLTDADCKPVSKQWLRIMQSRFSEKSEIILGYGPYQKRTGLLNIMIRFEAFFIGMQYLGYALAGIPYMGVGRNLAYKKEIFFKNKGFGSHNHIQSGDDDLFINAVARKENVAIELRHEAQMLSAPSNSFKEWWHQKRRHITTAGHYKSLHKALLAIFPLSQWAYLGLFSGLIFIPRWQLTAGIVLASLVFIQIITTKLAMQRLSEKGFWLLTPFLEIILLFLHTCTWFANLLVPQKSWK